MEMDDIPAVTEVEHQSFTMPWPGSAYRRELRENRLARYIVARRTGHPLEGRPAREETPPGSTLRPGGWRGLLERLGDILAPPAPAPALGDRPRRVVGYGGLWLMVDEAHITAIASAPAYRGLGVGELLLLGLIDIARQMGAQYVTLEVRVSNSVAQNLYRKYGFKETGVRRRYYSDNNEDALIMWSDPIESAAFRELVERNRRALMERLRSPRVQAELQARAAQL